jgi:hypothetical protein
LGQFRLICPEISSFPFSPASIWEVEPLISQRSRGIAEEGTSLAALTKLALTIMAMQAASTRDCCATVVQRLSNQHRCKYLRSVFVLPSFTERNGAQWSQWRAMFFLFVLFFPFFFFFDKPTSRASREVHCAPLRPLRAIASKKRW